MTVITVARQIGSRGDWIAEQVASRLGYELVDRRLVEEIAGTKLEHNYNLSAPKGVNGRNSDNRLIKEYLGWAPGIRLREGMEKTYHWIHGEYRKKHTKQPA